MPMKFPFHDANKFVFIVRARTFGFTSDLSWLKRNYLSLGATLQNTVVIDNSDVINEYGLRYTDELVRHKVLDTVGDLFLLGKSIIGSFSGYKSGHSLNNQLLNKVLNDESAWELVNYSKNEFKIIRDSTF